MPSPVDISYEPLNYLGSIGYARAKFLLAENHPTRDVCDEVASRFIGDTFVTLNSILTNAPVFGANPPAPIYGLTHPACRCSYLIYPPNNIQSLILPGSVTDQQKEEILKHMYPQQVWALSRAPKIQDIDFSAVVDVTPERPKRKNDLMEYPWYQEAWKWIKEKIFRQANSYSDMIRYAHTKTAFSSVRMGDLIRVIDDVDFVTELGISTPIFSGFTGLALGDYTESEIFVYIAPYNTVLYLPKDKLIKISNNDIEDPYLQKRIYLYNSKIKDTIEAQIIRVIDSVVWVYDFVDNDIKKLSKNEIRFID